MDRYDYPPRPEGETEARINQLWEALFRLIEQLNARSSRGRDQ